MRYGIGMLMVIRTTVSIGLIFWLAAGWSTQLAAAEPDALAALGARATEGAAAGYVDDAVCGMCHADKYESYQSVGMAQSFKRPGVAKPMEDFGVEYYHEPLQRYYQIVERDEDLVFRRYQRDKDGGEINALEIPVAWIMGSGNRARSYLFQTEWGEMFMLPIGWYSEDKHWGMSPGFEAADHPGITRQVPRMCLFCHNAFPEVPEGSDAHWAVDKFPQDLPQGTGCQRCHGPGAEHIRSALGGKEISATRDAIVNPARLSPELRDSVCFQCHMLPSASLAGSRRFGAGIYSFRPGQKLSDYMVHVDVVEQGVEPEDRFEINHHGYRLFQSSCYRESMGELACISCHDPHVKPESTAFRASVGDVCTGCHEDAADAHAPEMDLSGGACVTCHMPRRRTSDVIHVTMTDHRIARGPFNLDALIAPLEKENRVITAVSVLDLGDPPDGSEADAYRSIAALRSGRNMQAAYRGLEQALQDVQVPDSGPYVDLATSQFNAGRYPEAEATARRLIAEGENLRPAYTVLGTSLLAQGKQDEAIRMLKRSIELQPEPEAHFNLAAAYLGAGDYQSAEEQFDAAIMLRPYMSQPWKYKARLLAARNQQAQARDAFVRVLQLQPLDLEVYGELIDLLRALGEPEEAERYLELGLRMSKMLADL
ncbi:MAG: tetratricopeptide repeat protein [bacterium]|nr:tetratricopeptide repeat protein [bacterium]